MIANARSYLRKGVIAHPTDKTGPVKTKRDALPLL